MIESVRPWEITLRADALDPDQMDALCARREFLLSCDWHEVKRRYDRESETFVVVMALEVADEDL